MQPTDEERDQWWQKIREDLIQDYGLEDDDHAMQVFKVQVYNSKEKPTYCSEVNLPLNANTNKDI